MTKKRIDKSGTTTNNRVTIHLDEGCIRDLQQLKRRIDAQAGEHAPVFSLPALARHAIRKWCDHVAAPMPRPWEQPDSDEAASAEG
ncbi:MULTISPECIES: hypothetical protein [unclassified Pseudomonas]|uniref:hypothetical protein n=1 Tax=unclassified Pseudomonas TaxID=196821 RepID=UPI00257B2206|nr:MULTISPECIES: hypothetical protein [unclassified Pseudomonas]